MSIAYKQFNGNTLAFIGDGEISLYVRKHLVALGFSKSKDLQQKSVIYVSAKGQADFMQHVLSLAILSENEETMYKRGRNANVGASAKNASITTYRMASGFESLIGYLSYDDTKRMNEILDLMWEYHNNAQK